MPLFRKKEDEEKPSQIKVEKVEIKSPKPPPESKQEKHEYAPLFVKVGKYKLILSQLNDVRISVLAIKNALNIQKHIDELAEQNWSNIQTMVSKMEQMLDALDQSFTRPEGYGEERTEPEMKTDTLEHAISDLKGQISRLKTEISH